MKVVTFLVLLVFVVCCYGDEQRKIAIKFQKMNRIVKKADRKLEKIEEKMKFNKDNNVVEHPMSCGEIGLHRTILPQPQVQKVGKKVPGTLPGIYTIYKADYDNAGRRAACYSKPLGSRDYVVTRNGDVVSGNQFAPQEFFEPTNCQEIRQAIPAVGEDMSKSYWMKVGDEADLQRCEGDEVVMMQRGFGSGEIPNRKIDFKQHFEWYMKGFGKKKTNSDFFMGLDPLSTMTSQGTWQLTVTLDVKLDENGHYAVGVAKYSNFSVSGYPDYRLNFDKFLRYDSNIDDALSKSKGYKFSSWDWERSDGCTKANEPYSYGSSWWYGPDENDQGPLKNCGWDESPFVYGHKMDSENMQIWGDYFARSVRMTLRRTDLQNEETNEYDMEYY